MWQRWGVEIVFMIRLLEWWLLPLLLLAKDLDVVLELRKYCPFSIDVFPSGFDTLCCCLPPCDGFLFLTKPLILLLDPRHLFLFCSFVFEGLIFSIFHLDLLELYISLDDLYRRRRPRRQLVRGASIGLG
jgi:hypothetical protein